MAELKCSILIPQRFIIMDKLLPTDWARVTPDLNNLIQIQVFDDCMICASPMDANDPENLLVTTTECPKGHTFHKECLHHWCRRTSRTDDQKTLCPYCSTHIPDTCARLRLDSVSGLRRTFALQDGHMSQAEKDYYASKGEVVPEFTPLV